MASDPRFRSHHVDTLTDAIKASITDAELRGVMYSENGWYSLEPDDLKSIVNTSKATGTIKKRVDEHLVEINKECPLSDTTIYGASAKSKYIDQEYDVVALVVEYTVGNNDGEDWTKEKEILLGGYEEIY
ncbi:uncharacterized protein L203_100819 [Cryptococcus depauperatus CBS 7841]|uniref:Uncharacterized protein n=1 Tax=Cryptococcus depauperatus CBS 7841 TaxID=1295531 RepID=A0AAJ8JNR8_9TREE